MTQEYQQLLNQLLSTNIQHGVKLGLQNPQQLDSLMDYPSKSFPSIHVAGTNGKGSVTTKIAAAYQAAGFKVGLYTSPHIACFRERIRINGRMIGEPQVQKHLSRLFSLCSQHAIKATFFELTTLLAFLHFEEEKVDVAVLETGLGGRLDATNIVNPLLSIITSINFDHTDVLGNTIEAITKEKAGIIKPMIPVLIGSYVPKSVIGPIASANGSRCIQVDGTFKDYHEENSAIARQALEMMGIPLNAIQTGIKALPPCRMETFSKEALKGAGFAGPLPEAVILDVAHNPHGLQALLQAIRHQYGTTPLRFVIGLSSNKDIAGSLKLIKEEGSEFHLVKADNPRAASQEQLYNELENLGVPKDRIRVEPSINSAVMNAIRYAGENNEIVVVCGTFFIMCEVREALGIREPQDFTDMNERRDNRDDSDNRKVTG